jgi:putative ABC transport system permease protein
VLAGAGLYGVMSYAVGQRTQDFGIHMVPGASRVNVLQMVFWQSLVLAILGLLVGVACAPIGLRFFSAMLVGVSASDPLTFLLAALILLAVTLLASYLPASRAVHVGPMTALHCP